MGRMIKTVTNVIFNHLHVSWVWWGKYSQHGRPRIEEDTLGITRTCMSDVFHHVMFDRVYTTPEEISHGGRCLSFLNHLADCCGVHVGDFTGRKDMGHKLEQWWCFSCEQENHKFEQYNIWYNSRFHTWPRSTEVWRAGRGASLFYCCQQQKELRNMIESAAAEAGKLTEHKAMKKKVKELSKDCWCSYCWCLSTARQLFWSQPQC